MILDKEQAKLTDYNLVIEKHNQGLEPADVDYEWDGFHIAFSITVSNLNYDRFDLVVTRYKIRQSEKLAKFNESESESLRNIFEERNKSQQELEKVEKQIQIEINETQNLLRACSNWFCPV